MMFKFDFGSLFIYNCLCVTFSNKKNSWFFIHRTLPKQILAHQRRQQVQRSVRGLGKPQGRTRWATYDRYKWSYGKIYNWLGPTLY